MSGYKKYAAFFLLFALLLCAFTGCAGKKSISKYTVFPLFNETESPEPFMLTDGKAAGVYINPVRDICGFEVTVASVSAGENKVTLSIYEFTLDYKTSIDASPIASGTFSDVKDGEKLYFQFEDKPLGKYILTATSEGADIGIYRQAVLPSVEDRAHFYYQYTRIEEGAFAFSVVCRTSKVSGLADSDVFAVPDYSSPKPEASGE